MDVFCFHVSPIVLMSALSALAIITSLLLVSEIPMFSLKISSFSRKENKHVLILFFTAVVFIALFGILGVSATMVFYILYNILGQKEFFKN
jgi:CDP-diacylglycerol--serine O-phosphatidyltransferase